MLNLSFICNLVIVYFNSQSKCTIKYILIVMLSKCDICEHILNCN